MGAHAPSVHVPVTSVLTAAHVTPQPPQFDGSICMFTQVSAQHDDASAPHATVQTGPVASVVAVGKSKPAASLAVTLLEGLHAAENESAAPEAADATSISAKIAATGFFCALSRILRMQDYSSSFLSLSGASPVSSFA